MHLPAQTHIGLRIGTGSRSIRVNPLFDNAIEFVSDTVRRFYAGAGIEKVTERFTDDFCWIGAGEVEYFTRAEEAVSYMSERAPLAPSCEVFEEEYSLINVKERSCTVMGRYRVRTDPSSGMVLEEHQRCSYELVDAGGSLRICHVHVSNPYQAMKSESYFPFEAGSHNYDYLQQLLREKTETIDLITENINGGLKVSEDDEFYTFAYVNEGLARILGYTVEEFLEMCGGTAVGAVYPPDLASALDDVARCFADGPSYETEYRVRRKDGTLAWVLDAGHKVQLADGSRKISSVLMDITSRKQAEEDLRLEQERYRVAMRSVTDVLFECDIEQDTLIEYQRPSSALDDEPLRERRYPGYRQEIESGNLIYRDDVKRLYEALQSEGSVTVELRHAFPDHYEGWRWVRLHATMIFDQAGKPVRAIGSWKDVTDEHDRITRLEDQARRDPLTKLYNHVSAVDLVEQSLPSCLAEGKGALFVIDVDDFKAVNDTVGHLVGDDLLVYVAKTIHETFSRLGGFSARVGGDEFLAFLSHSNREEAREAASSLVGAVESASALPHAVTLSVGVALVGEHGETYERLFDAGDRALYRAKREGKDRICFFE